MAALTSVGVGCRPRHGRNGIKEDRKCVGAYQRLGDILGHGRPDKGKHEGVDELVA